MKSGDNCSRGFREDVLRFHYLVQRCGRMRTDDGRQVFTIAHPEPLAQVS